jgi:hypothetical protein
MIRPPIDSVQVQEAMLSGLTGMVRKRLRERILEQLEPDLEAAIDAAMDAFKATIETWRNPAELRDTIHVLVERKPIVSKDEFSATGGRT